MASHDVSEITAEHVRTIVDAAERLAEAVRLDAERRAEARLKELEGEVEARLREADAEAERRLDASRAQVEELLTERRRQIAELSDRLVSRAEAVLRQLDETEAAKKRLDSIVWALAETAEVLPGAVGEQGGASPAPAARTGPEPGPRSEGETKATAPEPPDVPEPAAPEPPATDRPRAGRDWRAAHLAGGTSTGAAAASEGGAAPIPEPEQPTSPPQLSVAPEEPVGAGPEAADGEEEDDDRLNSARLVALHMAVTGNSREETAEYLRTVFDMKDPDALIHEIFGRSGVG